jgi:aryl-alcohol dehydrogenase-like predicted oxidoreductase
VEHRRIGEIEVSVAGLGCNNFGMTIDEGRAREVVAAALDVGITHFDTAESYGRGASEEFLGRSLGKRRGDVVITTKFGARWGVPEGVSGGSPEWIRQAIEGSLRRLGTDHVDLYLLHRPDPDTPIGVTLEALHELLSAGKVREIGCSDFTAEMLDEAAEAARQLGGRGFANVQNHFSVLESSAEDDVVPTCRRLGMTTTPYFPLESGTLTGKYRLGAPPPDGSRLASWGKNADEFLTDARLEAVERLIGYAEAHGHTLPELALSWLSSSPVVPSVIAGATSPSQVTANAAATSAWPMTEAVRAEIRALA